VSIRDDLVALAKQQQTVRDRRASLVAEARRQGMTWREIASILDMTQQGLIKAQRAWEARGKPQG
jgi:transposase